MTQDTYVIVGASLAGGSAAVQLRKDGFEGRIVLIGREAEPPYERPELSKGYLRGEKERSKLDVKPVDFYRENSIDLETSTNVTAIDPDAREVQLEGGRRIGYDRLLLTTGSEPRRMDLPGSKLDGIHYLRTIADSEAIRAAASKAHRVVVIGGGWIGSEVSASLRQLGLEVAFVMPSSVPLEPIMGVEVGSIYRDLHVSKGVRIVARQSAVGFAGQKAVEAVETSSGDRLDCDMVVVGIGAIPRVELARAAGLEVATGVVVNAQLETSAPGIFAAGDIAEAWNPVLGARIRVEHWDNAKHQGRAAARNMLGINEPYGRVPYFYSDQFDLGMEYSGYAPQWDRVVFRGDPGSRQFVAFWMRAGRVVAGMNANIWDINDQIAALVRSGQETSIDRLTDPAVPLDDLDALKVG